MTELWLKMEMKCHYLARRLQAETIFFVLNLLHIYIMFVICIVLFDFYILIIYYFVQFSSSLPFINRIYWSNFVLVFIIIVIIILYLKKKFKEENTLVWHTNWSNFYELLTTNIGCSISNGQHCFRFPIKYSMLLSNATFNQLLDKFIMCLCLHTCRRYTRI